MTDLHCPNCGTEMDLLTAFVGETNNAAIDQFVALSVPLGAQLLQYIAMHRPVKQRLTIVKKIKLLGELLPDLKRRAITHRGRDWQAPLPAWAAAIDQMLLSRDAGKLELPLKGHGYLYAVIASSADRIEAQAEQQREDDRTAAARARTHSSGQSTQVGQLLQAPAPAQPQHPRPASIPGTSPGVLAMKAEIARKKGLQP